MAHHLDRDDVVPLHTAIGTYVTQFSCAVGAMREGIEWFAAASGDHDRPSVETHALLATLTHRMTAGPLSSAYFTLAPTIADLDAADLHIHTSLQQIFQARLKRRNELMHADWQVGYSFDGGAPRPNTARSLRVTKGGGLTNQQLEVDTETISTEARRLWELEEAIHAFTGSCIQLRKGEDDKRPSLSMTVVEIGDPKQLHVSFLPPEFAMQVNFEQGLQ